MENEVIEIEGEEFIEGAVCFNSTCEFFTTEQPDNCINNFGEDAPPINECCESFVNSVSVPDEMVDASASIPETQETVNVDLPMSKEFMFALPVFLTDVELGHYSKQQSDLWLKWGRLNQEKKDNAATFKRMIDQVESELDEVSRIVNEGSEERPVMCKWMFNYDENEKILIRLDSNAIVERKTISKEEMERWRNPELPIETPENVEEGDEATDTFTEGEELAEGGETEEIDAISSPDASTLVEEAENKVDEVSKEDLDKDWPDAPKGQQDLIKNIDKERKCCMPKDRDFHRDGDIRIMYCTICKLIIYKEDVTTTPYSHVPFEKGELFEEVAA